MQPNSKSFSKRIWSTVHGCFNLAHPDRETLEADYQTAQMLVNEGLFYLLADPPSLGGSHAVCSVWVL